MSLDFYATPPSMVGAMLGAVVGREFDVIVDPAAGDGRLLAAASAAFPDAAMVAVDCDETRATALVRARPDWTVVAHDFLATHPGLARSDRCLVLMNPPFSGRGGARWRAALNDRVVASSRAMAFLVRAASIAGDHGEVVALVPAGVLTNEKDEHARALLCGAGTLSVVAENPPRSFPGVSTRTTIVRWRPGAETSVSAWASTPARVVNRDVWVTRGALPVHEARRRERLEGGVRFVHTRSLERRTRVPAVAHIEPRACERIVSGPCVLIPRVGAPSPSRAVLHASGAVVLSDCLFALEAGSLTATQALHAEILEGWHRFAAAYGGSCAPFLRLAHVRSVVSDLGWNPLTGPAPVALPIASPAPVSRRRRGALARMLG